MNAWKLSSLIRAFSELMHIAEYTEVHQKPSPKYSKTSMTRTQMAGLKWVIQTGFWDSRLFFQMLKKTNI